MKITIKELKREYPDLLKNLKADKVSNEDLSKAINDVSTSLLNRIIIEKKKEELKEYIEIAEAIKKLKEFMR